MVLVVKDDLTKVVYNPKEISIKFESVHDGNIYFPRDVEKAIALYVNGEPFKYTYIDAPEQTKNIREIIECYKRIVSQYLDLYRSEKDEILDLRDYATW